jgi:hypothetical protein
LLAHAGVGYLLGLAVPRPINDIGQTVILPLAGVLVGLSFAWIGSALAIVNSTEMERLADTSGLGFETYVYTFQLAVLILLVCISLWGLGALGLFDQQCAWNCSPRLYTVTKAALMATISLAVRECWHVVAYVQTMIVYRHAVRKLNAKR